MLYNIRDFSYIHVCNFNRFCSYTEKYQRKPVFWYILASAYIRFYLLVYQRSYYKLEIPINMEKWPLLSFCSYNFKMLNLSEIVVGEMKNISIRLLFNFTGVSPTVEALFLPVKLFHRLPGSLSVVKNLLF